MPYERSHLKSTTEHRCTFPTSAGMMRMPRAPSANSTLPPATGAAYEPIDANTIPHNHLLRCFMRNGSVEVYVELSASRRIVPPE